MSVGSSIPVKNNLARSAILSWTGIEDMTIKVELSKWRIDHQDCHESLSRKHAFICSGAEEFLESKFHDIEVPTSQTIIDAFQNMFLAKNGRTVYLDVYEAIQGIRKTCLLQTVEPLL